MTHSHEDQKLLDEAGKVASEFVLKAPGMHVDWFYFHGDSNMIRLVIGEHVAGVYIPRGHLIMRPETLHGLMHTAARVLEQVVAGGGKCGTGDYAMTSAGGMVVENRENNARYIENSAPWGGLTGPSGRIVRMDCISLFPSLSSVACHVEIT